MTNVCEGPELMAWRGGACGPTIPCELTEVPVPFLCPLMRRVSQAEEGVFTQDPGSACGPTKLLKVPFRQHRQVLRNQPVTALALRPPYFGRKARWVWRTDGSWASTLMASAPATRRPGRH